jgi:hypothetical protein
MSSHRPSTSPTSARTRRRASAAFGVASLGLLVAGFVGAASPAHALGARVGLGTAAGYAVLASQTVTNTGSSVVSGDLGVSPLDAVTGFPPGLVSGTIHAGDDQAAQAQSDLTTAYDDAAARASTSNQTGKDLGGQRLTTGVYTASSSMGLTGTVTLDAQGDPGAVFVFRAGSTLTTASSSRVALVNGASPCNVFWQVGSSATLGTTSDFVGTIMALDSVTVTHGTRVVGRVLARGGAVTLDTNVITAPDCANIPTGPRVTATPTRAATTPTEASTGRHHRPTTHTPSTPVIPTGHPSTGVGEARTSSDTGSNGSTALFALAGLAGLAALFAALLVSGPRTIRRRR